MSARRAIVLVAVLAAAGLLVAGMVRYTRGVESRIRKGDAGGTVVKLLKERTPVPVLTAVDYNGRSVSTSAFHGKVILINFWATWCPPCREEIPDLIALQAKYKDTLQIIGIAQDSGSAADVKAFAEAHGMNYPSVLSTPAIEAMFPGVYALPTSFFLDHDGKIAQKHVGMLSAGTTELETQALAGTNPDLQIVYAEDEDKVRLANAAQANKIPGIDLSKLSPERRAEALQKLNTEHCTCGCGLTLAQCRLDDPDCTVSLPLAQDLVQKIAARK
jgi:thiol-disulfide isomerase/thioredoxin